MLNCDLIFTFMFVSYSFRDQRVLVAGCIRQASVTGQVYISLRGTVTIVPNGNKTNLANRSFFLIHLEKDNN